MSQSILLPNLQKQGFSPVLKKSYGTVLKSNSGLAIAYNDGNIEGFIKSNLNESIITETSLRHKIELLLLIGLGITYFTTDITIVDGVSMSPTYKNYQVIMKSKVTNKVKQMMIGKNAIIKFKSPSGETAIKRIVAGPEDVIELDGWLVKVNGKVIDDNNRNNAEIKLTAMIKSKKRNRDVEKFTLSSDQYYVMGDNREDSIDSRNYGPITNDAIITVLQK
jgi:signal peptidase I